MTNWTVEKAQELLAKAPDVADLCEERCDFECCVRFAAPCYLPIGHRGKHHCAPDIIAADPSLVAFLCGEVERLRIAHEYEAERHTWWFEEVVGVREKRDQAMADAVAAKNWGHGARLDKDVRDRIAAYRK